MADYIFGVFCAIMAGLTNFTGQILMKKGINDTSRENKENKLMKSLIHNRTWLSGILLMIFVNTIFLVIAQQSIGGALIPGLTASGLIILVIGSVKILGEKIKKQELFAILQLFIAIVLIGLSQLSIESSLTYFSDVNFVIRIIIWTVILVVIWWTLFFIGKSSKKRNALYLALASGIPFVVSNIWMQPFIITMGPVLGGTADGTIWLMFIIGVLIVVFGNVMGLIHFQYALSAGNAGIVIPIQQLPQQVAPIIIFYFIYMLDSPSVFSLPFLLIGIILILISGTILSKRQAALEEIK